MWGLAVPVRFTAGTDGASTDECLTLADRPPAGATAVSQLERCSALAPNDVELIADLGALYESAGRAGDAEAAYRRALAVDAEYADVHARLAALLLSRGQAAEATAHAETALRLQPNRRSILELIARASQPGSATR